MIVMKFGGTSVGTSRQIKKVADIVSSHLHHSPIIVVSALSGVTNQLWRGIEEALTPKEFNTSDLKARHETVLTELDLPLDLLKYEFEEIEALFKGISLLQECSARTKDRILAFGEQCSSKIVAYFLRRHLKQDIVSIYSYELGLKTDSTFGQALPKQDCYDDIKRAVPSDKIIVTTGYIAKDALGNITTLGRNGSDYSASIIGAAIEAKEIQIWTDVSGIMTADPTIISNAKPIRDMSFQEASELAYYGAKVIHPSTMIPAMKKNIPVRILNTNQPDMPGTTIYNITQRNIGSVKSIAHRSGLTIINITSTRMLAQHGFLSKIFDVFEKYKVVVDMISTSEVSVSLTVGKEEDLTRGISELKAFADVSIEKGLSVLSVIGEGVRDDTTVTARVFSILNQSQISVRMISMGASKINLSFIIDSSHVTKAIHLLHQEFFK